MSLATADLPSDPDALRAFALACQAELAAASTELKAAKVAVQLTTLEIEKLKFQIAKLRRMQFGRSSERIARQIEQLENASSIARDQADFGLAKRSMPRPDGQEMGDNMKKS